MTIKLRKMSRNQEKMSAIREKEKEMVSKKKKMLRESFAAGVLQMLKDEENRYTATDGTEKPREAFNKKEIKKLK